MVCDSKFKHTQDGHILNRARAVLLPDIAFLLKRSEPNKQDRGPVCKRVIVT
jgi:hypothetical protein